MTRTTPLVLLATLLAAGAARAQEPPGPLSADPAFQSAMAAYRGRAATAKHREAQEGFARVARERPTDYDAQIWCARTSFHFAHRLVQADDKQGCSRTAKAGMECARRAQQVRPGDYDGRYWELMNGYKEGATLGMVAILKAVKPIRPALQELIARDPKRFEGHVFLAMAYRELPSVVSWGDDEKALEHARKAYDLAPRDPEVLLELAEAWHENGSDDLARKYFKMVAGSDVPDDLEWETDDCRKWAVKRLADLD